MMNSKDDLNQKIFDSIKELKEYEINFHTIYTSEQSLNFKNEFLFFIKPEITLNIDHLNSILNLIFNSIENFKIHINKVSVLSSEYLKKYKIIDQHYGVINNLAIDAKKFLSNSAKLQFKSIFNEDPDTCNIIGAIEFLSKYKDFNAISLDYLWQNNDNIKLSGGTYCEKIKLDGKELYIVNGFHPRQLLHYTDKGRSIVVFELSSNLDWKDTRQKFIGNTNPLDAEPESLRNIFLVNKDKLGLSEVSQGMNGVHLSAGPVEGLIELIRYGSDFSDRNKIKSINDFVFGRYLLDEFSSDVIDLILSNTDVEFDNNKLSIFDLTEEKNSEEAFKILKKLFSF